MDYPRNNALQTNYDYQPKYAGDMSSFGSEFSNHQNVPKSNPGGMELSYEQYRQAINGQFQNRKAVGSGRERMKNHLANSFSRNEEISILPGFKRSTESLPRSSVKLRSTMLREVAPTQNPRHFSSPGGLNSDLQNSGYLDKSLAQIENKERENKLTRAMAQNVYKEELDRQIRERDDIRKLESGTSNSKFNSKALMGPSGDATQSVSKVEEVNTGYLPAWFPMENPKQDTQSQNPNYGQQEEMSRNMNNQFSPQQYQGVNNTQTSANISQSEQMYFQRQEMVHSQQNEMANFQRQTEEAYFQRQSQLMPASQSNSSSNMAGFRDNNSPQFRPMISSNSTVQQQCTPAHSQSHMNLPLQNISPQRPEKFASVTSFQRGGLSPQGQPEHFNQSFQSEYSSPNLQSNGGDPMKSVLKSHVSQTADMRPDESLLKREYKSQLEIQMHERKCIEKEREATEKEEERRLLQRIQDDQLKMKLEYEEEQRRQKLKEEELNQRQELILKKNAELKKEAEEERQQKSEERRARSRLAATVDPVGADSKEINPIDSEPIKPVSSTLQSINCFGDSISQIPKSENQNSPQEAPQPHEESVPPLTLKLKLSSQKSPVTSKKLIKPSAGSPIKSLNLLSDFKRILLDEADRMKEIIEKRNRASTIE